MFRLEQCDEERLMGDDYDDVIMAGNADVEMKDGSKGEDYDKKLW